MQNRKPIRIALDETDEEIRRNRDLMREAPALEKDETGKEIRKKPKTIDIYNPPRPQTYPEPQTYPSRPVPAESKENNEIKHADPEFTALEERFKALKQPIEQSKPVEPTADESKVSKKSDDLDDYAALVARFNMLSQSFKQPKSVEPPVEESKASKETKPKR